MTRLALRRRSQASCLGVISIGVVLLLGMSGCGGSSGAGTPSTTTTGTTPTTTTTQPRSAADERIARHAQLKLSDFPAGWEQQDKSPQKSQAKCSSVEAAKAAASARQPSPDFANGDTPQVGATVYVFTDVKTATHAFDGISGGNTRICLANEFTKYAKGKGAAKGVKFGTATSGQVAMPPVGDKSALGRLTIPVTDTSSGMNVDLYLDLAFVRVGRGIAILNFLDSVSPFDDTLRNQLTRTLVGRLNAALKLSN
jgi:hypothetical protein